MPNYEVQITEVVEPAQHDHEPTPMVRDVFWKGQARSDADATDRAWEGWDEKYGRGTQPADAIVLVTALAEARS